MQEINAGHLIRVPEDVQARLGAGPFTEELEHHAQAINRTAEAAFSPQTYHVWLDADDTISSATYVALAGVSVVVTVPVPSIAKLEHHCHFRASTGSGFTSAAIFMDAAVQTLTTSDCTIVVGEYESISASALAYGTNPPTTGLAPLELQPGASYTFDLRVQMTGGGSAIFLDNRCNLLIRTEPVAQV